MTEPNDFTPYSPAPVPAAEPPRLAAPAHLVGRAQGVQLRTESDPYAADRLITVLGFRLQLPDRPQALEVELRGPSLTGTVRDGDWVEVPDKPAQSGLYSVDTVANLSTDVPVTVRAQSRSAALSAVIIVFLIAVLAFFVFVLINVFGGFSSFDTF